METPLRPKVAIAIATYARPASLRELLGSLNEAISRCPKAETSIIVVDNDPEHSARAVCVRAETSASLVYRVQPIAGIAATRNLAVHEAADSDFIVFVDDDETVTPDWLASLLQTQETSGADMVTGPVHSLLPSGTPKTIRDSGIFDRETRAEGTALKEAATNNLLCKYSLFSSRDESAWFNLAFGLSGGSDAELTRRLHNCGAKIVWSEKAVVRERIPLERASEAWLARRLRRTGSIDYRLSRQRACKRVWGVSVGITRVMSSIVPLMLDRYFRRTLNVGAFRRFFRGIGFIEAATVGGHQEYKRR
ncbi:MAG: glycosyltransferase family 2 protein [Leucobacter sp.]